MCQYIDEHYNDTLFQDFHDNAMPLLSLYDIILLFICKNSKNYFIRRLIDLDPMQYMWWTVDLLLENDAIF